MKAVVKKLPLVKGVKASALGDSKKHKTNPNKSYQWQVVRSDGGGSGVNQNKTSTNLTQKK